MAFWFCAKGKLEVAIADHLLKMQIAGLLILATDPEQASSKWDQNSRFVYLPLGLCLGLILEV